MRTDRWASRCWVPRLLAQECTAVLKRKNVLLDRKIAPKNTPTLSYRLGMVPERVVERARNEFRWVWSVREQSPRARCWHCPTRLEMAGKNHRLFLFTFKIIRGIRAFYTLTAFHHHNCRIHDTERQLRCCTKISLSTNIPPGLGMFTR